MANLVAYIGFERGGAMMVIRNSLHLLDQISKIEKIIKELEREVHKHYPEIKTKDILKMAFRDTLEKSYEK